MYYVLDENNNKIEAYSKQEVLAVLAQAIADGSLDNITADSAFINKLKCCVGGDTFNIAFITQAKYNELAASNLLKENTYYYITDDETAENIDEALKLINNALTSIGKRVTVLEPLKDATSKQSEAKQYISDTSLENIGLIYDSSVSNISQPRADISNLMLEGKGSDDTIGMSGRLNINGSAYTVFFSALWNVYNSSYARCVAYDYTSAGDIVLFTFEIGIDANKQIYMANIKGINLTNNTTVTISTVKPYSINIFYK